MNPSVTVQILDLAINVFVSGGDDELEVPKPPSACPPAPAITSEMSKKDRYRAFQEKAHVKRLKGEMYSLWCDALYKLSIANHVGQSFSCQIISNLLGSKCSQHLTC